MLGVTIVRDRLGEEDVGRGRIGEVRALALVASVVVRELARLIAVARCS